MRKTTFFTTCPCCGERLVVDTKLRRLDPMNRDRKRPSSVLDSAEDILERDQERRSNTFDSALEEETGDRKTLDDLL